MLKNYIITALRHFKKHRYFSIINVAGLALSMAVCLLLILVIKDANEYDRFHQHGDRIYRINTEMLRKNGESEPFATSPYLAGATLTHNYTGIENWTMLSNGMSKDISAGKNGITSTIRFTDASFFELFGFSFQAGNANTLNDPYTLVLTNKLSDKLFPEGDAIGKSVEVDGAGTFKVGGILNIFPGKTHFEFDALASFSTIPALENDSVIRQTTGNWSNFDNYTYIRLKQGIRPSQAESELAEIETKQYKNLPADSKDRSYRFTLQSLGAITPGPLLSNNMGKAMSSGRLWAFTIFALVIIVSAIFNYTNLTLAHSTTRMKEIALRKVVGSSRRHIFFQIIIESVITSLIALMTAFVLLQLLIPQFENLNFIREADINFRIDSSVTTLFIVFAIVLGTVAGFLPAIVLSRVKPLMLLQKLQNLQLFRHLGLRKTLLAIQFMIALIFISLVSITYKQTAYQVMINFGSHQANMFNVPLKHVSYDIAGFEFSKIQGVEKISAISTLMGNFVNQQVNVRTGNEKDAIEVSEYFVDEHYIGNFDLKLVAGENFSADHLQQHEQYAIVNEKFVHHFGLGSPMEAVGKTILIGDTLNLVIKGVLKDFLFKPAKYGLEPLLVRYNPSKWTVLNLSIAPGNTMQTTARLEEVWKGLDPYHAFEGRFYDDEVQMMYAANRDTVWMIAFIGMLSIIIACLGLLGITVFTIQSKIKEICIRKVVGASNASLIRLLTKTFVLVMLIAAIIAIPIAVLLGQKLLQGTSQRIPLNIPLFIPGILLIVILSFLTIFSQIVKAIFLNPIQGLREE